jgi:uncharacterized Zn-binding protein involved in type VI secretion
MQPAARVGDECTAPHTPPKLAPGTGCLKVMIGKKPAWRVGLDQHLCALPVSPPAALPIHGPESVKMGAMSVLIDNQMACRAGDILMGMGPPNPIEFGDSSVLIGNPGFGLSDPANLAEY